MKRITLALLTFCCLITINAQQPQLKKGDVFEYQQSIYELKNQNNTTENLKRYKIIYKVLDEVKNGYNMEARFELLDDYMRRKTNPDNQWLNTRVVYPLLNKNDYSQSYENTLFQQDKVLFFLSNKGKVSKVQIHSRKTGLDPLMDQAIRNRFESTFFCPFLTIDSKIKVGDSIRVNYTYLKLIEQNDRYNIFELKNKRLIKTKINQEIPDEVMKKIRKIYGVNNNTELLQKYWKESQKALSNIFPNIYQSIPEYSKTKLIINRKTGIVHEKVTSSFEDEPVYNKKSKERIVLLNSKSNPSKYQITSNWGKKDTTITNPNIHITGEFNSTTSAEHISFLYRDKYKYVDDTYTISTTLKKDNTFEFNLNFDDLQKITLLLQTPIDIYIQPGDDIHLIIDSQTHKIINVSGIGSEKINFLLSDSIISLQNQIQQLQYTTPKPSQLKKSYYQLNSLIIEYLTFNKEENLSVIAEVGKEFEKLYNSDFENIFKYNQSLKLYNKQVRLNFNQLTSEFYLHQYWQNQIYMDALDKSVLQFNQFMHKFADGKMSEYIEVKPDISLPPNEYLEGIHLNNDLMSFQNQECKAYLNRYIFHIGDSLYIKTGKSGYVGNKKTDKNFEDHYNTLAKYYEGQTAFEYKLQTVLQSFILCSRSTYTNLYNRFQAEYTHPTALKTLNELYQQVEKVKPTSKAPGFELNDLKGNTVNLSDLKEKGLFIDFYANRDTFHMSRLKKVNSRNQEFILNKDIQLVLVYVDDDNKENIQWFKNLKINAIKLMATNAQAKEIAKNYNFYFNKYDAIIDIDGRIVSTKPPTIDRIYSRPNLMYESLISHKPPVDDKKTIKQLYTILFIVLGILFLVILVWLLYRRRAKANIKMQQLNTKVRELELTAIRAQMNPHFMYNCLNSIQNLVQKKQNDEAHQYLSKFASLIRGVLKNSEKEEISLAEELELIQQYVELEQLRFDIQFELKVDKAIDIYAVFVPPLILQPFVENAVLHGLSPKKDHRILQIEVNQPQNNLCISIRDNGIGRKLSKANPKSNGKGIGFSEERLNLLADKYGTAYQLNIEDVKDQNGHAAGTKVQICFPEE